MKFVQLIKGFLKKEEQLSLAEKSERIFGVFTNMAVEIENINLAIVQEKNEKATLIETLQKEMEELSSVQAHNESVKAKIEEFIK